VALLVWGLDTGKHHREGDCCGLAGVRLDKGGELVAAPHAAVVLDS
jgi:hypothetical protein